SARIASICAITWGDSCGSPSSGLVVGASVLHPAAANTAAATGNQRRFIRFSVERQKTPAAAPIGRACRIVPERNDVTVFTSPQPPRSSEPTSVHTALHLECTVSKPARLNARHYLRG